MTQTIVVLGGSFAGLQIAHKLVKNTRKSVKDLKVILVSKVSAALHGGVSGGTVRLLGGAGIVRRHSLILHTADMTIRRTSINNRIDRRSAVTGAPRRGPPPVP